MNIVIRQAIQKDYLNIAKLNVETWKISFRKVIPDDYLDEMTPTKREEGISKYLADENRDKLCFVAEDDQKQMIGFVMGNIPREGPTGYDCEIYGLYVKPQKQRVGLGRKLVKTAVEHFIKIGHESMFIWTLKEIPHSSFYRRIGGVELETKPAKFGDKELTYVCFGWKDLNSLYNLISE